MNYMNWGPDKKDASHILLQKKNTDGQGQDLQFISFMMVRPGGERHVGFICFCIG